MQPLLAYILGNLVDDRDALRVEDRVEGDTLVFRVWVAEDDRGRVIGKHGRTIQSVRTVVAAAASRLGGGRTHVEIVD